MFPMVVYVWLKPNVEKVFDKVDVGTEVQIIYNRLVIDKTFVW